jgi:hypothetical protein
VFAQGTLQSALRGVRYQARLGPEVRLQQIRHQQQMMSIILLNYHIPTHHLSIRLLHIIVGIELMRKQPKTADRIPVPEEGVQTELREINQSLNRFLQQHFTIEIESLQ